VRLCVWNQGRATGPYWAFPCIAILTLALIISAVVQVQGLPDGGFTWSLTNKVLAIDPSGPAARAGIQVGDVVIERDGKPFSTTSNLDRGDEPGDNVAFSLLRDGQRHVVSVTLRVAPPSVIFRRLMPLVIALSFWSISVATMFVKPVAPESWLFFLCSQAGAGVLAAGTLSSLNVAWAISLFNVLLCLLAALLVHFHLRFPVPKFASSRGLVLNCSYGLSLILLLPYILWNPLVFKTLSWHPIWRSSVRVTFALATLGCVVLLAHAYLTAQDPQIRRQVRLVAIGTALAFAPVVSLSILPEALIGAPLVLYEVTFPTLIFIPLAYAVAIYRYKLMRIDRLLNRSLVHSALGLLWIAAYLFLTVELNRLFPETLLSRPLLGALVTLGIAVTLIPLRQRIQAWVDRVFYGGWYDYRSVIAGVSTVLAEAQDEATLVNQLVHRVATTMGLHCAALFLADESGTLTVRGYVGTECPMSEIRLSAASPLARSLCQEAQPLEATDLGQRMREETLSGAEQTWLHMEDIRLWVPLVFGDELQGILVLGSKRADDFFDVEDVRILKTLAQQAALAAKNVRLLESLRRQVEQLTSLRDELETTHRRLLTSREEERRRLSRELHDRLLQELLAVNIALQSAVQLVDDSRAVERLNDMRQGVLRLADETRRICAELRPPALSIMGLADAIRSYTDEQAERRGNARVVGGFRDDLHWPSRPDLTITLDLAQDRRRLSDEVAITLFRVYQEALANVEKHAAAKNAWVEERLQNGVVHLSIRDDGCGFIVPDHLGQLARHGHFGLMGVYERVAAVGGEARITSRPGGGTQVLVSTPVGGRRE
jgi:signal transduction histidine kinase